MKIAAASTRPTRRSPCSQQHVSACFCAHAASAGHVAGFAPSLQQPGRAAKRLPAGRHWPQLVQRGGCRSGRRWTLPCSHRRLSLRQRRRCCKRVPIRQGPAVQVHVQFSTHCTRWPHLRLSHAITRIDPSSSWPQRAKYTTPVAAYAAPAPTCARQPSSLLCNGKVRTAELSASHWERGKQPALGSPQVEALTRMGTIATEYMGGLAAASHRRRCRASCAASLCSWLPSGGAGGPPMPPASLSAASGKRLSGSASILRRL